MQQKYIALHFTTLILNNALQFAAIDNASASSSLEPNQFEQCCQISQIDDEWCVINFSKHGTTDMLINK